MKIVIAPDSLKESLSALEAARAIARGVLAACPDATLDLCPMADGGEGTVEALVAATGGRYESAETFDPLGQSIRARFGLLGRSAGPTLPGELGLAAAEVETTGQGSACTATAVIEMAAASGLALVPLDRRDPRRTTTYGTGRLIAAAMDAGAGEVILGIGGSATCDGGVGAAQALGVEFLDADGEPCINGLAGPGLLDVAHVRLDERDARLDDLSLRIACDVTNPLIGPEGAAAVFGPQKGATAEIVDQLEEALAHLAEVYRRDLGVDVAAMAGAGAAGGLGAGLVATCGAKLEPGGPLIADAVGLAGRLAGADLCITAEGRLDSQSRYGKTPVRVQSLAARAGVSTLCLAGQIADDAPLELFAGSAGLCNEQTSLDEAVDQAEDLLAERTEALLRKLIDRGQLG
jgi:glycerate 2-kinase